MYKGKVLTGTALGMLAPIPFTTEYNTNVKTNPTPEGIEIRSAGYWDVNAIINVTGVVGNVTAQLYNGETPIPEAIGYAVTATAADNVTIPLMNQLHVVPALGSNVKLSVRINPAATVSTATLTIQERK